MCIPFCSPANKKYSPHHRSDQWMEGGANEPLEDWPGGSRQILQQSFREYIFIDVFSFSCWVGSPCFMGSSSFWSSFEPLLGLYGAVTWALSKLTTTGQNINDCQLLIVNKKFPASNICYNLVRVDSLDCKQVGMGQRNGINFKPLSGDCFQSMDAPRERVWRW